MTADRAPHVFRREGHPAGAGRSHMTDDEWKAFNDAPLAVEPGDIERLRAAVYRRQAKLGDSPWYDGILAAVAWAVGEGAAAPISAQPTLRSRPSWTEIAEEIDAAEDILYGQRRDDRPGDYATGVEHALMWLINDTDEAPINL